MKFTDGYWMVHEAAHPLHPAAVRDVEASTATLTVYTPAKPISQHGDTLNVGLFTVEFTSPLPTLQWRARHPLCRAAATPAAFPVQVDADIPVQSA